jgi:hypothetical protein
VTNISGLSLLFQAAIACVSNLNIVFFKKNVKYFFKKYLKKYLEREEWILSPPAGGFRYQVLF